MIDPQEQIITYLRSIEAMLYVYFAYSSSDREFDLIKETRDRVFRKAKERLERKINEEA